MSVAKGERVVRLLSAGSVEPGLVGAADAFAGEHGCRIEIDWATTPNIRRRLGAGEAFDLVLLTAQAAGDLAAAGKLLAGPHAGVGSVGVGVAVRAGAPRPGIVDPNELSVALRAADAVVFTLATSGQYVETMLRREGWYERLLPKIMRFETGPQMMDYLIHCRGNVVCLGAAVELRMFDGRGIDWVGPLPEPIQHRTEYVIAHVPGSTRARDAEAFVRYLGTDAARRLFAECGVEPSVQFPSR